MRPNAFQKILALVYLFLITVSLIFFVPFRNINGRYNTKIIYGAIWSDNSNIDLYRVVIYLALLLVTFYFLYRYLNKMNDLETGVYKKKAKTELIIFLGFILSILMTVGILLCINLTNQIRQKHLAESIQTNQDSITKLSTEIEKKKENRILFAKAFFLVYNYQETNEEISKVWSDVSNIKDDSSKLNNFLSNLNKNDNDNNPGDIYEYKNPNNTEQKFDEYGVPIRKVIRLSYSEIVKSAAANKMSVSAFLNESGFQKIIDIQPLAQIGIKSTSDLKKFIESNSLTDKDIKKQEEIKKLTSEINLSQTKRQI